MANTWNQSVTQTEGELKSLFLEGRLRNILVQETLGGYIVMAEGKVSALNETSGRYEPKWQSVVWCTRRADEPRIFSSLERLMDLLSEQFPENDQVRIAMLPPKDRVKKQRILEKRTTGEDGTRQRGRPPAVRLDASGNVKPPAKKAAKKAVKKAATKAKPKAAK